MKDGEKVVNQSGGSQSFVSARFDCIPTVLCSGAPKKPSPEPCPSTDGYPDQESQVKGY